MGMMACLYLGLRLELMLLMYSIKTDIMVPDIAASEFKEDSYASYCRRPINQKLDNLLHHWQFQEINYPDLAKMTIDMHSIPAMLAEYERVFINTKPFISDRRARLKFDIIDADECLKAWNGILFVLLTSIEIFSNNHG